VKRFATGLCRQHIKVHEKENDCLRCPAMNYTGFLGLQANKILDKISAVNDCQLHNKACCSFGNRKINVVWCASNVLILYGFG
jgi:hypothetical protein